MDYAILPFKTSRFLRLLRKAQVRPGGVIYYDGFSVISTVRQSRASGVDINIERYMDAAEPMLRSLCALGYLESLEPSFDYFRLTDMGWHYGEISTRVLLHRFVQSFLAPLAVSVFGTLASLHWFR